MIRLFSLIHRALFGQQVKAAPRQAAPVNLKVGPLPLRLGITLHKGMFLQSKTHQREIRMGRDSAWRHRRLLAQA